MSNENSGICWLPENLLHLFCYLNIVGSYVAVKLPLQKDVCLCGEVFTSAHVINDSCNSSSYHTTWSWKELYSYMTCSFHFTNVEAEAKNGVISHHHTANMKSETLTLFSRSLHFNVVKMKQLEITIKIIF